MVAYFIYEFPTPENDAGSCEDHFGIVPKDFAPKPAYEMPKRVK